MKYRPLTQDGKWYVGNSTGTKFWRATEKATEQEAKAECFKWEQNWLIKEVQDHERKSRKAFDRLAKLNPEKYGDDTGKTNWGDLVC